LLQHAIAMDAGAKREAAQEEVGGVLVMGKLVGSSGRIAGLEDGLEAGGSGGSDLFLQVEDVAIVAIECLPPDVALASSLDQLGGDAKALAVFAKAA